MMALAMLGGCGNNSTSGNSTANGDSAKATEKTADAGEAKEQRAIRSSLVSVRCPAGMHGMA